MTERSAGRDRKVWEGAFGRYASRIVSRHEALARSIAGRASWPVRDMPLLNRGRATLGDQLSSIGRWSESITQRVGGLARNVNNSLQGVVLRREMPGFVWFDRRQKRVSRTADESAIHRSALSAAGHEFERDDSASPDRWEHAHDPYQTEVPRAEVGAPRSADEAESSPPIRRVPKSEASDPLKAADFAQAHRERVGRQPTIRSVRDMREGQSVSPTQPAISRTAARLPETRGQSEEGSGRTGASHRGESGQPHRVAQPHPAGIDRDIAHSAAGTEGPGRETRDQDSVEIDVRQPTPIGYEAVVPDAAPVGAKSPRIPEVESAQLVEDTDRPTLAAPAKEPIGSSRSRAELISRVASVVRVPIAGMSRALSLSPVQLSLRGGSEAARDESTVEGADGVGSSVRAHSERSFSPAPTIGRLAGAPISQVESGLAGPSLGKGTPRQPMGEEERRQATAEGPEDAEAVVSQGDASESGTEPGRPRRLMTAADSAAFVSRMAAAPLQLGLSYLRGRPLSMVQRSAAAVSRGAWADEGSQRFEDEFPGKAVEGGYGPGGETGAVAPSAPIARLRRAIARKAQDAGGESQAREAGGGGLADAVAMKYDPSEAGSGLASRQPVSLLRPSVGHVRDAGSEAGWTQSGEEGIGTAKASASQYRRPAAGPESTRGIPQSLQARPAPRMSESGGAVGPTPYYRSSSSWTRSDDTGLARGAASSPGVQSESIMRAAREDSSAGSGERLAGSRDGGFESSGRGGDDLDLILAKLGEGWDDGASGEHIARAADDRPSAGETISRVAAEGEEEAGGEDYDLDGLARQVYPVIKRMLAIERERMGCGRW